MIISVPDSEIVKLLEEEIMEEERMSISPLVTRKGGRIRRDTVIESYFETITHIWNLWPTNPSLDINQNN